MLTCQGRYDALDRPTVRTQPGDTHTYYAYDEVGNRTSVVDPDANEAAYTYDPADAMSSVTAFGYTTYYEFDANGRMIEKLLGNGCVTYHTYDAAGRLTSLENVKPDLSALSTFAYTYDKDSNITEIVRESGEVQYYSYDALHRLTDCDWRAADFSPIYSFEYDHDAVGNRTRLGREYGDTYYTYDPANELVTETDSDGATSYEFDANGNQSAVTDADGTTYYNWTPENMLSRIDFADGGHNYFQYDGNLARVRKDDSAGTAKYTWDGLNILLEREAADQPLRSYGHGHTPIYGIGSLVAHEAAGDVSFYHQDQIGSTRELSDTDGCEVGGYDYAPFGNLLHDPGDPNGEYLLSGEAWDGDALLYHFHHRECDPARARFVSIDPAPTLEPRNGYDFTRGNPLTHVDPDGAAPWPLLRKAGVGGLVVGLVYLGAKALARRINPVQLTRAEYLAVRRLREKMRRGGLAQLDSAMHIGGTQYDPTGVAQTKPIQYGGGEVVYLDKESFFFDGYKDVFARDRYASLQDYRIGKETRQLAALIEESIHSLVGALETNDNSSECLLRRISYLWAKAILAGHKVQFDGQALREALRKVKNGQMGVEEAAAFLRQRCRAIPTAQ